MTGVSSADAAAGQFRIPSFRAPYSWKPKKRSSLATKETEKTNTTHRKTKKRVQENMPIPAYSGLAVKLLSEIEKNLVHKQRKRNEYNTDRSHKIIRLPCTKCVAHKYI